MGRTGFTLKIGEVGVSFVSPHILDFWFTVNGPPISHLCTCTIVLFHDTDDLKIFTYVGRMLSLCKYLNLGRVSIL